MLIQVFDAGYFTQTTAEDTMLEQNRKLIGVRKK